MRHKYFALCILIAICNLGKSQTIPSPQKIVTPKTFTIKLKNEKSWNHGYLSGINDSSVQLSSKRVSFPNALIENPSYQTYNYADIEKVSIRKYGSVGRGMLYGTLIGAGVGGIMGLATYHRDPGSLFDFGPGFSALAGAIIGAIPGIIVGGIIGLKMKKFNIHRNKEKFKEMETSILEMALSKSRHAAKDSSANGYVAPSNN